MIRAIREKMHTLFFSIGMQINALFSFLLLLFFLFTVMTGQTLDTYSAAYKSQMKLFESAQQLKKLLGQNNDTISEYLKTGNRVKLAEFNHAVKETEQLIGTLRGGISDEDCLYLLSSIGTAYGMYFSECCRASFLFNSHDYNYYGHMYTAENIHMYLQKYSDELLEQILDRSVAGTSHMFSQQRLLKISNAAFMIILIAAFFIFLRYVTVHLTHPMEKLVTGAHAVSAGDFTCRVPVQNIHNSVGDLTDNFNRMVAELQKMMESMKANVQTEKKLLREQRKNLEYREMLGRATFLALQTQTNPHFLFNTLNSISRTITLGKTGQALTMIDSLASLLRYSLSDAATPVPLQTELEITGEYLRIQKLRFGSRIEFRTQIEPDMAEQIELPKFTLQPLVENAIIHGIEPAEHGGKIIISAKRRGKTGIIRIFDNGLGIPEEKLRALRNRHLASKSGRIGVANTQKRLELHEKSAKRTFSLISREGKWTMITIRLTLKNKQTEIRNTACTN